MRQPRSKVKKRSPLYVGSRQIHVRIPPEEFAKLEAWIERQQPRPTHPEALRRLMAKALACEAAQGAT
jgi:hypothetical protein